MTSEQFNDLMKDTFARMTVLSTVKGGEYAGDGDRFENFKRNARNLNLTPNQIWSVYAAKHWDALMQYIRDEAEHKSRERLEPIAGRIDDLLVYLCLLKGMLLDTQVARDEIARPDCFIHD